MNTLTWEEKKTRKNAPERIDADKEWKEGKHESVRAQSVYSKNKYCTVNQKYLNLIKKRKKKERVNMTED